MLYNGKLSGLNYALWYPHFSFSAVQTTLRAIEQVTYMADRDIREIILRFILSKEVRPYFGVDKSNVCTEDYWEGGRLGVWGGWESKMMGLAHSHYHEC